MKIRKTLQASTFSFILLNLIEKAVLHSLDYGGVCKERSTKLATDNFQRRAILRKINETLKRSILSLTITNLVNKGILYFLITTGA